MTPRARPLFGLLKALYERSGWTLTPSPDLSFLWTTRVTMSGPLVFGAMAHDDPAAVTLFSRAPVRCPPNRFDELERYFALLNFRMLAGAWVLDRENGEIRFRIGFYTDDIEVTAPWLMKVTERTLETTTRFLPLVQAVVQEGHSAESVYGGMVATQGSLRALAISLFDDDDDDDDDVFVGAEPPYAP